MSKDILNICEREDGLGPYGTGVRWTHPNGAYAEIIHDDCPAWNPVEEAEGVEISFRGHSGYSGTTDDHPADPEVDCPKCDGDGYDPNIWVIRDRYRAGGVVATFHDEAEADAFYNQFDTGTGFFVEQAECGRCDGAGTVEASLLDWFKAKLGAVAIHEFSTGQYNEAPAVIVITTEDFTDPEGAAKAYADEYSKWAEGDVWGVEQGGPGIEPESVWGFIGIEYAKEQAAESLEWAIEQVEHEQSEAAYWADRGVPTV